MLDRRIAPPFQKASSFILPDPLELRLTSGAPLYLVQGLDQNVAKIEVLFNAGKWFENKTGVSHFMSTLLEKGTRTKSAEEIAGILDYHGSSLEVHAGFDFVSVALYVLKTQWKHVIPVFLEIITEPTFPEDEWLLARDIYLQNLKVNKEKTSYRASTLFRRNVFGGRHPYGSAVEEAESEALSIEDLRNYFNSAFTVHSLYGVGNFTDAEIADMKQSFTVLHYQKAASPSHAVEGSSRKTEHVEKEGSVQSSIRLGRRSLVRTHPDYFDLQIFNHILGGFFGSRLMKNIREEKGLTYGIYSSLNTLLHDGLFVIGADVNKENVSMATEEIRKELRRLAVEAVGDQELRQARNHFIGSLQADTANLFSVSEKIKNIHVNGLPRDYYQKLFARVNAVTAEDILRVAQTHVSEESMIEVVC